MDRKKIEELMLDQNTWKDIKQFKVANCPEKKVNTVVEKSEKSLLE